MAVTSVTTTMTGAINYTVVTDTSADWTSVANSTYFYDKVDKLVHYKDSTGVIQEIFSGSGITIGTTPSTGTDTRVFFQEGGVVQQDASFTFDNTQKRLTLRASGTTIADVPFRIRNSADNADLFVLAGTKAFNLCDTFTFDGTNARVDTAGITRMFFNSSGSIGVGTITPAARLDVRAQGALSTDIAFRVRNSADTATIGYIAGNGLILLGENTSTAPTVIVNPGGSSRLLLRGGTNQDLTFSSGGFAVLNCAQGFDAVAGSAGSSIFRFRNGNGGNVSLYYGGLQIGTLQTGSTSTNFTLIANGVAPSVNYADSHWYYSADIVAGNAAPHFRTENGSVIKLYKQDLPTNPTNAELATFLSNLGLANLI